mgnify:CR=1 FL=1
MTHSTSANKRAARAGLQPSLREYRTRDYPLQLTHGGVCGFARTLMGDEQLLYAMCDAPDLVHAIMEAYTAMYPFEAGAGCRVAEVRKRHPELGVIGGLAKEAMIYGQAAIDKEMEKARRMIALGRLIPGPDHFVQSDVSWKNHRYFMERLREVFITTKPVKQQWRAGGG